MTRVRAFGSDTFRSPRNRNFRLFFIGQGLSQNGTWMQLVAIDLLVLRLTDDGVAVGLATAARFAPMILLRPWAGLLSDRSHRHKLLLWLAPAGAILASIFAGTVPPGPASVRWFYLLPPRPATVHPPAHPPPPAP